MLSNLLVNIQRFILIIDDINRENIAQNLLRKLLLEQQEDESTIKIITLDHLLNDESILNDFLTECEEDGENPQWNVILPPLSDLLIYKLPATVFEIIHDFNNCPQIKRTYLWAASPYLIHPTTKNLLSAFEYMADLVLHIETVDTLIYIARFPDGSHEYKRYGYSRTYTESTAKLKSDVETSNYLEDRDNLQFTSESSQLTTRAFESFAIELNEEKLELSSQNLRQESD